MAVESLLGSQVPLGQRLGAQQAAQCILGAAGDRGQLELAPAHGVFALEAEEQAHVVDPEHLDTRGIADHMFEPIEEALARDVLVEVVELEGVGHPDVADATRATQGQLVGQGDQRIGHVLDVMLLQARLAALHEHAIDERDEPGVEHLGGQMSVVGQTTDLNQGVEALGRDFVDAIHELARG